MKHFGWLNIKASVVITGCYCRTPTRGEQDVNREVIITDCFQLAEYIYIITTLPHYLTPHQDKFSLRPTNFHNLKIGE